MRDIKINLAFIMNIRQEAKHTGYRSSAIHIIVAKYQDLFLFIDSRQDTTDCYLHVFHLPGIMKIGKLGPEIFFGSVESIYSSLDKYFTKDRMNFQGKE